MHVATHAFTDAFAVMAGVSAVIMAIVAIVGLRVLRRVQTGQPEQDAAESSVLVE